MFNTDTPKPGTTKQTANGGTITYHSWGLVHKAGNNYSGASAPADKDDLLDDKQLTKSK